MTLSDTHGPIPLHGIGMARVMAGAVAFKDSGIANLNATYRGEIYTQEGETRFAILKDLPARELANEVMIAALGNALSLPVPPSYIAYVIDEELQTNLAPSAGSGKLMFASCDVSAPSVSSMILRSPQSPISIKTIVDRLVAGGTLPSFYEFDSWGANTDRHPGNLLLSGSGLFWLIDHGFCFTGPSWKQSDLVAEAVFRNRLKEWVTPNLSQDEIDTLIAQIGILSVRMADVDIRALGVTSNVRSLLGPDDFDAMVEFLTHRIAQVPRLSANALGRLA